jgi:hypothetical protein
MAASVYQSVPLDSGKLEIRFLILHPATSQSDEIVCDLFHASLDDELKVPTYEALSYEWASPSLSHALILNGTLFGIRENLHAALTSLRKPAEERVLWIDAICINQTDNAERGQQVQIMHLIYSKADRVIGWLGEEQAADRGAKSAFENLLKYITSRDGDYNRKEVMTHYLDPDGSNLPRHDSSDWGAIGSILGKTWFTRVWVIQEIVMARHLSLRCGNIELDRSIVEHSVDFLINSSLMDTYPMPRAKKAREMFVFTKLAMSTLEKSDPWPLMEVLSVSRSFGASVPRDRLFALLNVVKTRDDPLLVPDYEVSDTELYIKWAAHSLVEESPYPYWCLSLASPSRSRQAEKLPTWVPDWGAATTCQCLCVNSTFETLTDFPPQIQFSDCQRHLNASGMLLSTIGAIGNKPPWKDEWDPIGTIMPESHDIVQIIKEFIDEAEIIASEVFSSNEYPFEMFWRTLIVNTTLSDSITSSKAPPEYARSFKAYREVANLLLGTGEKITEDKKEMESLLLESMDFERSFVVYAAGRKFGITQDLRMGMFPNTAQTGDIVFAPMGAKVPFVLRAVKDGQFTLVGECYVHGVMYGEIAEEPGWETKVEDITIY